MKDKETDSSKKPGDLKRGEAGSHRAMSDNMEKTKGIPQKWPYGVSLFYKMVIGKKVEIGHEEN
jgi:hypothetical protein